MSPSTSQVPNQSSDQRWFDDGHAKHHVPLAPAVPIDPTVNTWSRFGPTFEAYEYSGWIDESISWKTDCYIGDWSPLLKARVKGPEAQAFFEFISTNRWPNFKPGQAKHAIFCQDNGCVVGEGLVLMLAKDDLIFTSGPGTVWLAYQFQFGRKKFDATLELVSNDWFLLQVQGPRSAKLLNEVTAEGVQEIEFMHYKELSIDGTKFLCLRQGVSGELGFELWGPAKDARKIYSSIVDAGKPHNLRQLGARTKMVNHVEAAFATPAADFIPAVHAPSSNKELVEFRRYAKSIGFDFDLHVSKASGSYGTDPVLYHNTPFDLNWGWLVNLDHDFIGRDALAKLKADPPRKLVTLVWDKDDVADVFASLFRSESYEYMEMPRNLLGNVVGSSVSVGSQTIGYAVSRCYSYWFKEMISLGIVLKEHASPGTEVLVKWGSEGSKQKIIKAIVQPAPYKEDKRRCKIV
ncbi:Aminomethyltransferase [Colletotrichum sp. SAR 10_70]|nr:Aminomethyltransferase [Colletotrichum sp. SAR 10_71]KAI8184464.1 Aminomethyltransferase [Colletotrichum sp. SAR 10_70]KAI8210352.1 Aminomethyltransferase [Colletotrichum sp. SAR 10_76]